MIVEELIAKLGLKFTGGNDAAKFIRELEKIKKAAREAGRGLKFKVDTPTTGLRGLAADAERAARAMRKMREEANRASRVRHRPGSMVPPGGAGIGPGPRPGRVKHRLDAVLNAEAEAARRSAYDAVVKERDVLASKLRDRYAPLAQEIAELLDEVMVLNGRVHGVNQSRPEGGEWLDPVEHVARGPVTPTYGYSSDAVFDRPGSLVRTVVLPKFGSMEAKGAVGYLWFGREKAE